MEQIVAGALGGLGFSIVFGVRKKYMLLIALNAGLSWAVFLLVNAVAGAFAANIAGSPHQGAHCGPSDARHRAHDPRRKLVLYHVLYFLRGYGCRPTLFYVYCPCNFRYGDRFCHDNRTAQNAG